MTRDVHDRFRRDYAPAFLRYLSERDESGLEAAYELGRRAMVQQLSVLDLAQIHHAVLLDVLKTHRTAHELEQIAQVASEFLVEALGMFEMTQRGFAELRETAHSHQEHARELQTVLERQLAIEQARGMVMERHGLAADKAMEWIRQAATGQGIAVDEVAARLVGRQPPRSQRSGSQ
jgi:hypothetical protein